MLAFAAKRFEVIPSMEEGCKACGHVSRKPDCCNVAIEYVHGKLPSKRFKRVTARLMLYSLVSFIVNYLGVFIIYIYISPLFLLFSLYLLPIYLPSLSHRKEYYYSTPSNKTKESSSISSSPSSSFIPDYFARHHRGQSVKCASRRNESDESTKVGRIEALSTAHQEFRKAAVRWSRRRFRHHVE